MEFDEALLPLTVPAIEKCIPHRYPFLLVDRITKLKPNEHVLGHKNISACDPFLQGHFPQNPIFPGVLMIEGMAQTAGVLGFFSVGSSREILLTEVNQARFRQMVVPGDCLTYDVVIERIREPFFWYHASALVDGKVVARAKFSALLK